MLEVELLPSANDSVILAVFYWHILPTTYQSTLTKSKNLSFHLSVHSFIGLWVAIYLLGLLYLFALSARFCESTNSIIANHLSPRYKGKPLFVATGKCSASLNVGKRLPWKWRNTLASVGYDAEACILYVIKFDWQKQMRTTCSTNASCKTL